MPSAWSCLPISHADFCSSLLFQVLCSTGFGSYRHFARRLDSGFGLWCELARCFSFHLVVVRFAKPLRYPQQGSRFGFSSSALAHFCYSMHSGFLRCVSCAVLGRRSSACSLLSLGPGLCYCLSISLACDSGSCMLNPVLFSSRRIKRLKFF
jgi:hypothetical protein